jgi:hypothetical protein
MKAEVIAIGSELLLGQIIDTNTSFRGHFGLGILRFGGLHKKVSPFKCGVLIAECRI